jgi:hypothetical protein
MPEKADTTYSGDDPVEMSVPPTVKAYVKEQIQKSLGKKKRWRNSWRSASPITKGSFLMTLGIAIATIAYAVIAAFQLSEMGGQLVQMRNSTKASQDAAYAACESARVARSTLVEIRAGGNDSHNLSLGSIAQAMAVTRSEAAHLRFSVLNQLSIDDNRVGKTIQISNIGKTTALNTRGKARVVFLNRGEEPDFTYLPKSVWNKGNLEPGEPPEGNVFYITNDTTEKYFTWDEIQQALELKEKRIFAYGRMTYTDIFGVDHWVQYCGVSVPPKPEPKPVRIPKCAAYNQADKNQIMNFPSAAAKPPAIPDEIVCRKPE